MRAITVAACAAVLALAACGDKGEQAGESAAGSGESSTASAAAPAGAGSGGASAAELTALSAKRRPGKWRMSMGSGANATPPTEICMTAEQIAEQAPFDPNQSGAACPGYSARRQGDTILMSATCPDGQGGSMRFETKLIGDFETRYRVESLIRTQPASGQPADIRTFLDMQYVGPC